MDHGILQVFYKCFTVNQIGTCEIYGKKLGWDTDQQPRPSPVKNRKNSGNPIIYCKYPDSHDRVFPDVGDQPSLYTPPAQHKHNGHKDHTLDLPDNDPDLCAVHWNQSGHWMIWMKEWAATLAKEEPE